MKLQLSILRNMIMEENTIYTPFPAQLIDALKAADPELAVTEFKRFTLRAE